jgi:hypothetical protein
VKVELVVAEQVHLILHLLQMILQLQEVSILEVVAVGRRPLIVASVVKVVQV